MELKLNIGYGELLDLVRQLPVHLQRQLQADIANLPSTEPDDDEAMRKSAKIMLPYYQNDKELTAFTVLDSEDFYETE